jgi:hypothetical protein
MEPTPEPLTHRLEKLGLACDHFSLDRVTSATAALACFPMYMVANVNVWSQPQRPSMIPVVNLPDLEALREAFEIGKQESRWEIDDAHRSVLKAMLAAPKPADRIVYEYAVETLRLLLLEAGPELAETIRTGVAQMIVAVAHASGEGFLGTGEKISDDERTCIRKINTELGLDQTQAGAWLMERVG